MLYCGVAMASPVHIPPAHGRPLVDGGSRRLGRALAWIALALAVVGAAGYLVWQQGAEDRAIRSLPAEERRAQFLRTAEELRTICADPPEALRAHCRQQAEFLSRFPECDAACRLLVERFFPVQPAR
jgi:uncharacterized protein HemX